MQLIAITEPGAVAIGLRGQRITIERDIKKLSGTDLVGTAESPGSASALHSLRSDYFRVCELLLRICRVPLAPPGKVENSRRPTLTLEPEMPEMTVPDLSPSHIPSPSDSQTA